MGLWAERVLPILIEKACRSTAILDERRRWVPRAHGNVLELGVGSGLNLGFYDAAKVDKVTGVDPSAALLARAAERHRAAGSTMVPVELVAGRAEQLAFADRSFDSALVTYSLCSVADPARALAEVRRVLRPGGELIFVEHGLAVDAGTQRWQHWLTPLWSRLGGGCHLDRDLPTLLRAAGYRIDEFHADYAPDAALRWLSYTFEGVARPQ